MLPLRIRRYFESRRRLIRMTDRISRLLRVAAILLLAALILSQIALRNESVRHWLTSAAKWEGTRL